MDDVKRDECVDGDLGDDSGASKTQWKQQQQQQQQQHSTPTQPQQDEQQQRVPEELRHLRVPQEELPQTQDPGCQIDLPQQLSQQKQQKQQQQQRPRQQQQQQEEQQQERQQQEERQQERQQQQQQQQHEPAAYPTRCNAVLARGKRADSVCGAAANPWNTLKCKRHCEGGWKKIKRKAPGATEDVVEEDDTHDVEKDNFDGSYYHDGIEGGGGDLATKGGGYATFSTSKRNRHDAAKGTPLKQEVHLDVFELDNRDKAMPYVKDVEEEDREATKGGRKRESLPPGRRKAARDPRDKHQGGENFGLADETRKVLPGQDRARLDVLRNAAKGKSRAVPARFFDLCFPVEVVDYLTAKVTEYARLCTTPSDRRQARNEATATTKGKERIATAAAAGPVTVAARAAAQAAETGVRGDGEGGVGGVDTPLPPLTREELVEFDTLLAKLGAVERVEWNQRLANELLSRCQAGLADKGRRQIQHPVMVTTYHNRAAKSERACWGDRCQQRKKRRYNGRDRSKTFGLCWCNICSLGKGKKGAVYLCKACNEGKDSKGVRTVLGHIAAAARMQDPAVKKARATKWAI